MSDSNFEVRLWDSTLRWANCLWLGGVPCLTLDLSFPPVEWQIRLSWFPFLSSYDALGLCTGVATYRTAGLSQIEMLRALPLATHMLMTSRGRRAFRCPSVTKGEGLLTWAAWMPQGPFLPAEPPGISGHHTSTSRSLAGSQEPIM